MELIAFRPVHEARALFSRSPAEEFAKGRPPGVLKKYMIPSAILCISLLPSAIMAKERLHKWQIEDCERTVHYDPELYNPKTIERTWLLFDLNEGIRYPRTPLVFKPKDLSKIDIKKYQRECKRALGDIRHLDLVSFPVVEEYRRAKTKAMRDTCSFDVIRLEGYRDPSALRKYTPSRAACSRHIDALEGKHDLKTLWREVVYESCKRNEDPMRCIDETLAAERAPDADARIRIYVTGFGWNNCSVPYLKVNTIDLDALRKRFYSEFERKFKSKLVCSE